MRECPITLALEDMPHLVVGKGMGVFETKVISKREYVDSFTFGPAIFVLIPKQKHKIKLLWDHNLKHIKCL